MAKRYPNRFIYNKLTGILLNISLISKPDRLLAAQQGDAEAQNSLGVMYAKGQGVRQDKRIAKEWFGKACDAGLQAGCENYRKLNEQGY